MATLPSFEELFRQHYDDHEDSQSFPQCHWCQLALFPTHLDAPTALVNTHDTSSLSSTFAFISSPKLGAGVTRADSSFRTGCTCSTPAQCQTAACQCLQDMCVEDVEWGGSSGKIYTYHSTGARHGLLKGQVRESREPIYECHGECACVARACKNRVVEHGRTVGLVIFRTANRGWGVRATSHLRAGQYVDKYIGEIITHAEANRRREASDIAQRKDVYLFALDKFSDPDSMDERLAGPPLEVDGEFLSGPTRFINHSCEPNLRIFARVGDHADKHLHDLAFFAVRDIDAGEELTFDYVDGETGELEADQRDPVNKRDMTECLCGSDKCRGWLW